MRYFSFQWHITDNCDQRCKHCYIFSGSKIHVPVSMRDSDIETVFANCMNFCETFGRIPYFYITGGDPILHSYFWKLLETFNAEKIFFSILGNPFHIDDYVCEKLKALGCEKYQLSIDGMRNTHDFFRKPGSFDETLSKISCINNAGICSVIRKDHLWTLYNYEAGRFTIPKENDPEKIYGGCNCGNAHITILPNGDVYACRRVHNSKVGNALVNRLADLWVNEMEEYREYKNFVKCSKCELLSYCRGCPAVSKGTYGNFYAEDPQCWKEI